jgi:hypothetical protein
MWARSMMGDASSLKESMKFLILTSPVSLHSNNFPIKLTLNVLLEIKKGLINIRTLFEQINPGELAKIIDKAYIVCMFSGRKRCRTPYIRKTCSRGIVDLLVEMGYGSW